MYGLLANEQDVEFRDVGIGWHQEAGIVAVDKPAHRCGVTKRLLIDFHVVVPFNNHPLAPLLWLAPIG
jgi:hypothetical protein